jgi:hypothetical protein
LAQKAPATISLLSQPVRRANLVLILVLYYWVKQYSIKTHFAALTAVQDPQRDFEVPGNL